MIHTIRLFLIVQAATFVVASLIHAGMFVSGYEHRQARIAESVIAIVLLAGLALTWGLTVAAWSPSDVARPRA